MTSEESSGSDEPCFLPQLRGLLLLVHHQGHARASRWNLGRRLDPKMSRFVENNNFEPRLKTMLPKLLPFPRRMTIYE